jgi:hypothetical protein
VAPPGECHLEGGAPREIAMTPLRALVVSKESRYYKSMKSNTKSSITLPPKELQMILDLQRKLKLTTKVEVVRRGLVLLKETLDREALRKQFRDASVAARASSLAAIGELDHLVEEGIDSE